MNIGDFLPHHLIILNPFGMDAFLPELVSSIIFMGLFIKSQLLQNLTYVMLIQVLD